AADAAGAHLDRRHHVVERLLEDLDRVLLGLALDDVERAVDDRLGDRLLALVHDRIHELGDDPLGELRVGQDLALVGTVTAGHGFRLRLFRTLRAVLGTALLAVLDALRVEHAAQDVVANAGQVLDAAAADHDDRVLLQVMALARDVADHLEAVGEADFRDLAQRRVRLLRRGRVDAGAHTALLRALLESRELLARPVRHPRLADELIDRRHARLHPHSGRPARTIGAHRPGIAFGCAAKLRANGNRAIRPCAGPWRSSSTEDRVATRARRNRGHARQSD